MKILVFPLSLSLAILAACGDRSESPVRAAGPRPAPIGVQAVAVTRQEWPEWYEATGAVRARTAVSISSKVMAYVQEVSVNPGDRVREGQVLVRLDARDLEANVRRAEAARAEVASSLPEADNGIAAAKANLDLAQSTFKRIEELASKKSVSNQEFDEAGARLKAAQAAYDMARARRTQLDPKLAQVEQEIHAAAILRDYARLVAPFAGIVTARTVDPGALAAPGAPLIALEHEGGYRLEVSLDESALVSVKVGQPVEVGLDALDRHVSARVSEVVPAVDSASRTYTVKLDLPALSGLRSGVFGRASFARGSRTVVAIPNAAIVERGQLQSVFVVEDASAHSRVITTGKRVGGAIEVLSGLSEGEKVIAPPPATLSDGARVEVRP
jgi:multidrug efflux system membrane fusion protein